MNDYNREQYTAFDLVRRHGNDLRVLNRNGRVANSLGDYLQFRRTVDRFLQDYFSSTCHEACYRSRLSACCSREGIITFFADVVVNTLHSPPAEIEIILNVLQNPGSIDKCVYLGKNGCLWRIKPIVCTMFLCDRAQEEVFGSNSDLRQRWEHFQVLKKRFTWPDRPVLFDDLESGFIEAGYSSALMYLHNSPGLLRLKQTNGIISAVIGKNSNGREAKKKHPDDKREMLFEVDKTV